jgi:hypothetical protein
MSLVSEYTTYESAYLGSRKDKEDKEREIVILKRDEGEKKSRISKIFSRKEKKMERLQMTLVQLQVARTCARRGVRFGTKGEILGMTEGIFV